MELGIGRPEPCRDMVLMSLGLPGDHAELRFLVEGVEILDRESNEHGGLRHIMYIKVPSIARKNVS
jgi:hypothetical protein